LAAKFTQVSTGGQYLMSIPYNIITARCYAERGYAMLRHPSVRL